MTLYYILQLIETWLGKDEEALRKLITASKGSSVIANYIHVDRERIGITYKHALMITSKVNESTQGGEDDSVSGNKITQQVQD